MSQANKQTEEAKDLSPKNIKAAIAVLRAAGAPEKMLQACLKEKSVDVFFDVPSPSNNKIWKGVTPLTYATETKNQKLVEILLDYGANVNLLDRCDESSPLSIAIDRDYPAIVPVLFTHSKTKVNFNFRHLLVASRRSQAETLLIFLSDPQISQLFSYDERTSALETFIQIGDGKNGIEKHAEVIQAFIAAGVNSKPAFEEAVKCGNTTAVHMLYEQEKRRHGARPGEAGLNRVILHYKEEKVKNIDESMGCEGDSSYREMVMCLLDEGANPAPVRHDSSTPQEFISIIDEYQAEKRTLAAAPPPYGEVKFEEPALPYPVKRNNEGAVKNEEKEATAAGGARGTLTSHEMFCAHMAYMAATNKLVQHHQAEFDALLQKELALLQSQAPSHAADVPREASRATSARPAPTDGGDDSANMVPLTYGGGVNRHTVLGESAKASADANSSSSSSSASSSHHVQME